MDTPAIIAEVISVQPNKVRIAVYDLDDFKIAEQDLKVGSYLQISDDNNVVLIAIVTSFSIDLVDKSVLDSGGMHVADAERRYILEANPLGTIVDGVFTRGGDTLSIPPKKVEPANKDYIRTIFTSNIKDSTKFTFAHLNGNPSIPIPVDGNKFFNKHIAIVGSSGSGKSHTVAKVLQEAISAKNGKYADINNSHIVLFDIHSEYSSAFPDPNLISIENLQLPFWLLNSEELEELFLESGDFNNYNQASLLRRIITENKKVHNQGVADVFFDTPIKFSLAEIQNCLQNLAKETKEYKNPDTIAIKTAPITPQNDSDKYQIYFKKVYDFEEPKSQSFSKGLYADGSIEKFISRFENKTKDRRLEFLLGEKAADATFEQVIKQFIGYSPKKSNVTVIDLSGIPYEVLSITVSLISRLMFQLGYYYKKVNQNSDIPILLVYEEAHKYAPKSDLAKYRASREAIERVAKEGRKYGVTLAIVSQRPSEISETIFSQCNTFLAMRLTNPDDQSYVKRLLPDTLGTLTDSLPSLQAGEALLIGDSAIMPAIVKILPCSPQPSSNDIPYLEHWKQQWKEVDFGKVLEKWSK